MGAFGAQGARIESMLANVEIRFDVCPTVFSNDPVVNLFVRDPGFLNRSRAPRVPWLRNPQSSIG